MAYQTTFRRNGTVTMWNVYSQTWLTLSAVELWNGTLLSTLPHDERIRVARMVAKSDDAPATTREEAAAWAKRETADRARSKARVQAAA